MGHGRAFVPPDEKRPVGDHRRVFMRTRAVVLVQFARQSGFGKEFLYLNTRRCVHSYAGVGNNSGITFDILVLFFLNFITR